MVALLLNHPETVFQATAVDGKGLNALMLAVQREGCEDVVRLLLTHASAGAQVNAVGKSGWTALKVAVKAGHLDNVGRLLATAWGRAQADRSTVTERDIYACAEESGDEAVLALLRQAQPGSH